MRSSVDTPSKHVMVKDEETVSVTKAYNTHPMECAMAIQSPGILVSIINYMVHEMCALVQLN